MLDWYSCSNKPFICVGIVYLIIAFLFTLLVRREARGLIYGLASLFILANVLTAASFTVALGLSITAATLGFTSYIILGEKIWELH